MLPAHGTAGPVTAMIAAGPRPGEVGTQALERIGAAVLPPAERAKGNAKKIHRKLPRQLAAIVACRTEGMSDKEIAEALSMTTGTVRKILYRARKELHMSDLVDRVEHRAVHSAVDNLIDGLDGKKGPQTEEVYTLATLKGTGVFRTHSAVKQETTNQNENVLRVVIEMPEIPAGHTPPQIAIGNIIGAPISLSATPVEVIAAESVSRG